jgi:Protein of unknown function (DUF3551)
MTRLQIALAASVAIPAMSALTQPAAANEYPWCVIYGDMEGKNCGFVSYDQCMLTARGAGGYCEQNLFYPGTTTTQLQRPRKRHASN